MPDYRSGLPTNYYFGGGGDSTFATPLAIIVLLTASILILLLPRKYAFVPFLVAALFVPVSVVIVIGSLHFNATRILVVVGGLRLLFRRDRFPGRLQTLDKIVLSSALCSAVMYSLLWQDLGAAVNRVGGLLTTMGTYVLLRFLVQDKQDVVRVIKTLAAAVVVIAPIMLYEHVSAYNAFWLLGAPGITNIRDGQVRAQGPFAHAIIAGTVGAFLVPLFVGLFSLRSRLLGAAAVVSSTVMVLASRSATPVLTYAAAVVGLAMWPARKNMRKVRWAMLMLLLLLQLAMNSPIWFVMTRASGVLGGSGWHRSMLVDNFVRHFSQWWLIGTRSNADWGWSMWDVDNAYVGAGISGGLLSFILFIAVIVYAYKLIGRARKLAEGSTRELRLIWVMGAALFANTVAYFGITYFDQASVAWYTLLAMIAVVPTFVTTGSLSAVVSEIVPPEIDEEITATELIPPSHSDLYGRL